MGTRESSVDCALKPKRSVRTSGRSPREGEGDGGAGATAAEVDRNGEGEGSCEGTRVIELEPELEAQKDLSQQHERDAEEERERMRKQETEELSKRARKEVEAKIPCAVEMEVKRYVDELQAQRGAAAAAAVAAEGTPVGLLLWTSSCLRLGLESQEVSGSPGSPICGLESRCQRTGEHGLKRQRKSSPPLLASTSPDSITTGWIGERHRYLSSLPIVRVTCKSRPLSPLILPTREGKELHAIGEGARA
ncbi:hypothetical protein FRB90_007353 [Tulasnella sp. 427]|nr:hypothetical protein FRB90_007353 [Tulasnella sp. 427]